MVTVRRQIGLFADDIRIARSALLTKWALLIAALALLPWLATFVVHRDLNIATPLAGILGVIVLYWFFTRGQPFRYLPVRHPVFETAIALAIVLVWILYRLGEYNQLIAPPTLHLGYCDEMSDTLAPKVVEMVLLPLSVFLLLRYTPSELGLGLPVRAWVPALLPIAAYIVWGLSHQKPEQLFTRTSCFFFGAGLPEELLFRGILLTRLEYLLKRPALALFLSSLVFGASHLPIDLHGTGYENWSNAFFTAFTFQMGVGFALGFAFQRSRNLFPLTLLHSLIDAAPLL